ncbi:MAG: ATP-binding cassette domain-containing protein, partial [Actinobacteria bacterium]|nr:ATP-binding cassette domain-containing protein [Actinomycetota bacterium]
MLLDSVSWNVSDDERWVVMGPNGAGKTTLMQVISTRMFPTRGSVRILGEELGSFDLAELRPLIGWASSALANDIPPAESVANVVLTGAWA